MPHEIELAAADHDSLAARSDHDLEIRQRIAASSKHAEQQEADGNPNHHESTAGSMPEDTGVGSNSHNSQGENNGYPTGIRLGLLTFGLMAIVLMVALDNYILATAIPRIAMEFRSLDAVAWFASSYFLTQMAFQPAFGHLFSDFAITKVCAGAILTFEIGSIVCALARNSPTLIIGRLIAGAGGAGLYVGTLTFVGSAVPVKNRPLYLSFVTIFQRTVAASSAFLLFISMIVGQLVYYLPLYFQTVQGATARESGVRNLPFLVTMLFAPMISGALINLMGYYVPFMMLGSALATIGSGLLFRIQVDTSKGILYFDQFLAGLGLGLCTQISFTAVQYILPADEMVMGSALVSFCNSLGPILGTNIGQVIFANVLVRRLERVPNVNATMAVIAAVQWNGAT
ncbi:MAG: hypothetical protein Q9213_002760 [Squamulea squamosa]